MLLRDSELTIFNSETELTLEVDHCVYAGAALIFLKAWITPLLTHTAVTAHFA
jgi:hypothetical protein